jgi:RNA polymerase sigma factor (sigma-70 family)
MAGGRLHTVINQLRRAVDRRGNGGLTDAQLLEAFVSRGEEAAFEVLVWRHGAMVLGVCQRVLRDVHEAEDAFQAAFLIFARKAASIGIGASLSSWLYKVAFRVACRARSLAARRPRPEPLDPNLLPTEPSSDPVWRDLRPVLDEEVGRLPDKYRIPFVLCYLEGHTNEEAARQLGCPRGTILSRLARARERLRARLSRRGLALSAGVLALALSEQAAAAALPATLVSATVPAGMLIAAGKTTTGLVSARVAVLTKGALQAMGMTKIKVAAALLLVLGVLGWGTAAILQRVRADRDTAPRRDAVEKPAERPAPRGNKAADIVGLVTEVSRDGTSLTLRTTARGRGAPGKVLTIKLDAGTQTTYYAVGPDGARPTKGYTAQVGLKQGSNDTAARVWFRVTSLQRRAQRSPDHVLEVAAVSRDGKTITLNSASRQGKNAHVVRITPETRVTYSSVTAGYARPTEGYHAMVWLQRGTRDAAARIRFFGTFVPATRPEHTGTIVALGEDGKSLTLRTYPGRGEKAREIAVAINDRTRLIYLEVPPDGARPTVGYVAKLWWADELKGLADRLDLTPPPRSSRPAFVGRVVGVSGDGKEVALVTRGGQGRKVTVKTIPATAIYYFGVGPGEARVTKGYRVNVYLELGSKDIADRLEFSKPGANAPAWLRGR